jgi:hypothetical protein
LREVSVPETFDAGTVHADLQLDRKEFIKDLKQSKKDLIEFTKKPYEAILKLDLKQFHRDLKEAETELKRFSRNTARASLGLNTTEFTRRLRDAEAELSRFSRRTASAQLGANLSPLTADLNRANAMLRDFSRQTANASLGADITELRRNLGTAEQLLGAFGRRSSSASLGLDSAVFRGELNRAEAELSRFDGSGATATVGVNSTGFHAEMARVRQQLDAFANERRSATVTISANLDLAGAQARLFEFTAQHRSLTVQVDADTTLANAKIGWLVNQPRHINISVDADTALASAKLGWLVNQPRHVMVHVDADTFAANEGINWAARRRDAQIFANADIWSANHLLDMAAGPRHSTITAHADTAVAAAHLAALSHPRSATVHVDADTAMAHAKLNILMGHLAALNGVSTGSGHGMLILAGALFLTAGAVSLLSTALAGVPGLLAALGVPILAITLGMDGLKRAFEVARPAVDGLKVAMSAAFEAGFIPIMHQLAHVLIPAVTENMVVMARVISIAAGQIMNFVTSGHGLWLINTILSNINYVILQGAIGLTHLTSAILTMAQVGTEALGRFMMIFNSWAAGFDAMIQRLAQTGQLGVAFDNLGRIVGIVLNLFTRLMDIGIQMMSGPFGTQMVNTFAMLGDAVIRMMPFLQAMGSLFMALLSVILPPLVGLLAWMAPGIQWIADAINNMSSGWKMFFGILIIVIGVIGGLIGLFIFLAPIIAAVAGVLGIVAAAFGTTVGVVLLVIGIIAALIAAVIWLALNWQTAWNWITDVFSRFGSWIMGAFLFIFGGGLLSIFGGFLTWIVQNWQLVWNWVSGIWNGFMGWLGSVWGAFWGFMTAFFWNTINGIGFVWQAVWGWVSSVWNGFMGWLGAVWGGFWSFMTAFFWNTVNGIGFVWQAVWGWVSGVWNGFTAWLGAFFANFWTGLVAGFGFIVNGVGFVWQAVWGWVSGVWNGFTAWLGAFFGNFWTGLVAGFGFIVNGVGFVWQAVWGWVSGVWNGFTTWLGGVWHGFWGALVGFFGWFRDQVIAGWHFWSGVIGGAWNAFTGWLGGVWNGFWGALVGFFGWFRDQVIAGWHFWTGLVSGAWNAFSGWLGGVWAGFWNGIVGFFRYIGGLIAGAWTGAVNAVGGVWNAFSGWLGGAWAGFWNAIMGFFRYIGNMIRDAWNSIWDWIKGAWGNFTNWFGGAWNGFWGGIFGWLSDRIKEVIGMFKELFGLGEKSADIAPPGAPRAPGAPPGQAAARPARISRGTTAAGGGKTGMGSGQYLKYRGKQYANDTQVGLQPANTKRGTVLAGKNAGMTRWINLTTGKQVGDAWPAPRTRNGGVIAINSVVSASGRKLADDSYGGRSTTRQKEALGQRFYSSENTYEVGHGEKTERLAKGALLSTYASGGWKEQARASGLQPMSASTATVVPPNTWRVIGDRMRGDEAFIPINNSRRSEALLAMTAQNMGFGLSQMAEGGITPVTPQSPIVASAAADQLRVVGDRTSGQEAFIPVNNSVSSQSVLADTARRMGFDIQAMAQGGLLGSGTTSQMTGEQEGGNTGSLMLDPNGILALKAALEQLKSSLDLVGMSLETGNLSFQNLNLTLGEMNQSLLLSGEGWTTFGTTLGLTTTALQSQLAGVSLGMTNVGTASTLATTNMGLQWPMLAATVGLAMGGMNAQWTALAGNMLFNAPLMQGTMDGLGFSANLMGLNFSNATNWMGAHWAGFAQWMLLNAPLVQGTMGAVDASANIMAGTFSNATNWMGMHWGGFAQWMAVNAPIVQGAMGVVDASANFMAGNFSNATNWMGMHWGGFTGFFFGQADALGGRMAFYNGEVGAMGGHFSNTTNWMGMHWQGFSDHFEAQRNRGSGNIAVYSADLFNLGVHFANTTNWMGMHWQGFADHFEGQRNRSSGNIAAFGTDLFNLGVHFSNTTGHMGNHWQGFADHVRRVYDSSLHPSFMAIHDVLGATERAFGASVNNIGNIWNGLKPATARPVNFMISEVYNKGIVGAWNRVAVDFLKQPALAGHPNIAENAKGGVIPGYSPGRDNQLSWVSGGEAVMRPEWTRAMGEGYIHEANQAARAGGVAGVRRFVSGHGYGTTPNGRSPRYMKMENPNFPAVTPENIGSLGRIPKTLPLPAFRFGGYGRVAPHVAAAGDEIQKMLGEFEVGGFRAGPPDHGTGHALDFMTYADKAKGDRIVAHMMQHASRLGIKYLIWQQKINDVRNNRGWEQMEDRGSITQNHYDHVHASFMPGPGGPGFGAGGLPGLPMFDPKEAVRRWWLEENTKPFMETSKGLPGKFGDTPMAKAVGEPFAGKIRDIGVPWVEQNADGIVPHIMDWIIKNFIITGPGPGPGGGAERWRPVVEAALRWLNLPLEWANVTLRQIQTESGGNPRAVNNWDSNAARGTPSGGLLQTIGPTFAAYRDPRLPNDMFDPFANIVASMRYAMARYGSLPAAYRGVGYDTGVEQGALGPGSHWVHNWSGRNEFIARDDQLVDLVNYGAAYGSEIFDDGFGETLAEALVTVSGNGGGQGDTYNIQSSPYASAEEIVREARFASRHARKGVYR